MIKKYVTRRGGQMKSSQVRSITTEDLMFSAYLKMKGYRLLKSDNKKPKACFTFETDKNIEQLQTEFFTSEFIKFYNSEFLRFYKELNNLKKMISPK